MEPATAHAAYSAQDWVLIIGAISTALVGVLTGIATIVLQLRTNTKVEAAKAISTDTNQKTTAIVAQSREIARAVPGASTDATDIVIQRGEAVPGAQRATDPNSGA